MLDKTEIKLNSQVPKEALTIKNQFHKLNFTQTTKNTLKIKKKKRSPEKEALTDASKIASLATSDV